MGRVLMSWIPYDSFKHRILAGNFLFCPQEITTLRQSCVLDLYAIHRLHRNYFASPMPLYTVASACPYRLLYKDVHYVVVAGSAFLVIAGFKTLKLVSRINNSQGFAIFCL